MDLARIKQNLRLRSGRTKVTRREGKVEPQSHTSTPMNDDRQPLRANPPGPLTALPSFDDTQPQPRERSQEDPEQRVTIQDNQMGKATSKSGRVAESSTAERPEEFLRRKSTRYGKSGIEIPMAGYLEESAPLADMPQDNRLSHAKSYDHFNFDLSAPAVPSANKKRSVEQDSELLFSGEHLKSILHNPPLLSRFTNFLHRFLPAQFSVLIRYLETQKAIKAVAYANAVIEGLPPLLGEVENVDTSQTPRVAASLDEAFEVFCTSAFNNLVENALPLYFNYSLVKNVSDLLTTTITGRATPMTRELVDGLSEVFCLTDPNQEDNPIIYASEEFYRFTRYSRDDVIGYNCRFLQGPRTNKKSIQRLATAIREGKEITETVLNYRRDGRPFFNLLMIAPLLDDQGQVKYFLGAQVDASGMIEGGRGLDSFHRCLMKREFEAKVSEASQDQSNSNKTNDPREKTLARLHDLSEMFDLEESAVVQAGSRPGSAGQDSDARSTQSAERPKSSRRTYAEDNYSDIDDEEERQTPGNASAWRLSQPGSSRLSGRLPGVYETYMLIRPAPSLRIVFVSPKLHKVGSIVQSPFLSHVAAAQGTLVGLRSSLMEGTPVTAKIYFMPQRGQERHGTRLPPGSKSEHSKYGRSCWISCTPLRRVDEVIGVWIVVFVEETKASFMLSHHQLPETAVTQLESGGTKTETAPQPDQPDQHDTSNVQRYDEEESVRQPETNGVANPLEGEKEVGNDSSIVHTPVESQYVRPQPKNSPLEEQNEISRAYQHVPTSQSPPLPEQGSDLEDNTASSDEEFVQTKPQPPSASQNERVVIRPDSEIDPEVSNNRHEEPSSSGEQETIARSVPTWSPPEDSPRSIPSDAQFPDGSDDMTMQSPSDAKQAAEDAENPSKQKTPPPESEPETPYVLSVPPDSKVEHSSATAPSPTPDRSHREAHLEEQSKSPAPEAQLTQETSDSRPSQETFGLARKNTDATVRPASPTSNYRSSGMRLEYVMMPNSRQSTESYRGMTGSWQVRPQEGSESDKITEGDCARSPYSVD